MVNRVGGGEAAVKGTEEEGRIMIDYLRLFLSFSSRFFFSFPPLILSLSLSLSRGDAAPHHKPCLASEADTSSANVASCGESTMLMLPVEETLLRRRGEASPEMVGDL